ncbi:MAG: hypothetical protein GQ535_17685 [Rhodobacteraceae bacterium]|nr:hypothetical protein [Paracoccaceae bacterium]
MPNLDRPSQTISVEWVLIALLSVFILNSIMSVLMFIGVVSLNSGLNAFDVISVATLLSIAKSSTYWLAAVGALWFVAHRLGFQRWFVLTAIGVTVSVGLTLLLGRGAINLFWFVAHAGQSALMGWVLWRLAYQKPAFEKQENVYQTTIGRGILAMICGSMVGGSATMVVLVLTFLGSALGEFEEVLLLVMGFWLGGVLVLGGIPFVVFHSLGLRQWYVMTLVGSAVMLLVGLFVVGEIAEPEMALVLAAIGSGIGWIIWRVAYRRAPLER